MQRCIAHTSAARACIAASCAAAAATQCTSAHTIRALRSELPSARGSRAASRTCRRARRAMRPRRRRALRGIAAAASGALCAASAGTTPGDTIWSPAATVAIRAMTHVCAQGAWLRGSQQTRKRRPSVISGARCVANEATTLCSTDAQSVGGVGIMDIRATNAQWGRNVSGLARNSTWAWLRFGRALRRGITAALHQGMYTCAMTWCMMLAGITSGISKQWSDHNRSGTSSGPMEVLSNPIQDCRNRKAIVHPAFCAVLV